MQKTFSELAYAGKNKPTRQDRFLADLKQLIPWALLEAQLTPLYADYGFRAYPEFDSTAIRALSGRTRRRIFAIALRTLHSK
jgi:IS5 family transposase